MAEQQWRPAEADGRDAAVVRAIRTVARFSGAADAIRVRLAESGGHAVAQVNARAAGQPIRVQVTAASLDQAVDELADRLARRILEAADRWSPRKWPGHDGPDLRIAPPGSAATGLVRPARVKHVRLAVCSPETAVSVMDLMDYPVHLFVDAGTGLDAIVYRAGPTGYRLARLRPAPPPTPNPIPLAVDPRPAVPLPLEGAIARLDETGLGHLFFADSRTRRGQLLYRRYDTGYTLVGDSR
jgi:hypothetical protein